MSGLGTAFEICMRGQQILGQSITSHFARSYVRAQCFAGKSCLSYVAGYPTGRERDGKGWPAKTTVLKGKSSLCS